MSHPTQNQGNTLAPGVRAASRLIPLTVAVFVAFLTIGIPLPVLPIHVHETLGLGTSVVGFVMGIQFAAALLSRAWTGSFADSRGGRPAISLGLVIASLSGLVYLLSLAFRDSPATSVGILLIGRLMLGCAESLVVTGAFALGIGLVGPQSAGKAMAWIGIAIYAAYAVGAPIGISISTSWGFAGIAVATVAIPLLSLAIVRGIRHVDPPPVRRVPFYAVLRVVMVPGLGLGLSSIGFGVITAFVSLLFAARHWDNASFAFTAFGVAFIVARLAFGHLPDKIGGARVALVCVVIEALGQLLIWGATEPALAYVGAALTGFGYSLAFPGFGVEAVRRAPPQSRGVAMGAYVAFLDIALGVTTPVVGAIGGSFGIASVYLVGAVAVALSFVVALRLLGPGPARA